MNLSSAQPAASSPPPTLTLYQRLQLVPPARIIAAEEDSGELLTLGDLRQFSKYLANEFLHAADVAASHPASWYQAQIEHCGPEQAIAVRLMTIELCEEVAMYQGYEQGLLAGGERQAEALNAVGVLMLFLAFLLLIPLLAPEDEPAPAQPTTVHAPAAMNEVAR